MYVYGLCLLFDFATKNLHLATMFYHLVAKWLLKDFVNFEPCPTCSSVVHKLLMLMFMLMLASQVRTSLK